METSVRFVMKDHDKHLLRQLAQQDGDASMSATLRRLIRAEAARRGLAEPRDVPPSARNGASHPQEVVG